VGAPLQWCCCWRGCIGRSITGAAFDAPSREYAAPLYPGEQAASSKSLLSGGPVMTAWLPSAVLAGVSSSVAILP